MKRLIALVLISAATLSACGPASTNTDQRTNDVVEAQQDVYAKNQPIPFYNFSMQRDALIQIYNAANESRQTYSVIQSDGTGEITDMFPSVGFAIPADTQLTNPVQISRRSWSGLSWVTDVIEQPEPNGLYSSKNTDGTYVLRVLDNGDVVPVYTEQKVTTYPYPIQRDPANPRYSVVPLSQESSIKVTINAGSVGTAPSPSPKP